MSFLGRRSFLLASGLPLVAASPAQQTPATQKVSFTSDGISHTPVEFANLLGQLTKERDIVPDEYSRGGIVAELERQMASLLGKETAIFLPTGTLANHVAVRLLAAGGKVIVQQESHLYNDSEDCAAHLSGLNLVPLASGKASFTLDEVEQVLKATESGRVAAPIGAISIESPVRRKMGELFPFEEVKRISAFAREHGIRMHLDGARLLLAAPYLGVSSAQYASLFDTVYVSLYKYFNAGFGAILAGPHKLLDELYQTRRMFGGGLCEVWPQAAVALHYADGFEARYARAVAVSEGLLTKLASSPDVRVNRIEHGSNIAFLSIAVADAKAYGAHLENRNISAFTWPSKTAGSTEVLLVTNETILRRSVNELTASFLEAMRVA